jgi:predicted DCC family thiol-disulfide oxidoreductase YuxK
MRAPAEGAAPRAGSGTPILFFDGVCGLCNRLVDFLLRADRRRRFRFAPLQGTTARELLSPSRRERGMQSVIYLDEAGVRDRSDAVLEVCRRLGGVWSIASLMRIVPRPIRDGAYGVLARNRYRWFGRRDSCRVPAEHERERFLP